MTRAVVRGGRSDLLGIACIVTAMSLMSISDALARDLADRLPVMAMVLLRSLPALIPILIILHVTRAWGGLATGHPVAQLARGGLIFSSYSLYLMALTGGLSFAMSIALVFTSPLFVAALSPIVLKERVTRPRWIGTIIGFLGVVVAMQPGIAEFQPVSLYALASGLCYACSALLARKLGAHDPPAVTSFYTGIMFLAGSAPFALFASAPWDLPQGWDIAIVVVIGLIAGSSHTLIIVAYAMAPAAKVAPFEYIAMFWGAALGYVFWAEIPALAALVGVVFIMVGGLVILYGDRGSSPPAWRAGLTGRPDGSA